MKKVLATVGVVLMVSSALAQTTPLTTPDAAPKKDTHGKTVSSAAHQVYEEPGKGKFISQIARLKAKAFRPLLKDKSKANADSKAHQKSNSDKSTVKIKNIDQPTRPDRARKQVFAQKTGPANRPVRVNRPNPGRRPAGTGRFTQIGRG